ncbi:hypothetical protein CQ017_16960 [Arthrobacter sp. MYb224]|uniref:hypothetical protein n=1 Tax=Arthrobacter sp. MYb224 TaxID=1848600 RepID=UPI000CFD0E70|nr:hypothetical protein [Arthrobacter sp. MYb224]PQZ96690.1 hypothetical protein CQ017_16960 [Arthrobacter sp. MYb224]
MVKIAGQKAESFTLPLFGLAILAGIVFGAALGAAIFWPILAKESPFSLSGIGGGLVLALANGAWIGAIAAVFPATGATIALAIREKKRPAATGNSQALMGAIGSAAGGVFVVLALGAIFSQALDLVSGLASALAFLMLCFAIAWMSIRGLAQRRAATWIRPQSAAPAE